MSDVFNSIMTGLTEALDDAKSCEKKFFISTIYIILLSKNICKLFGSV